MGLAGRNTGHSPPSFFVFYIGGSGGPSLYLRLEGDTLICERTAGGRYSGDVLELAPGHDAWEAFFAALERIGVWDWESEYDGVHACSDVTYWHLRLEAGERTISSRGANAYPGTGADEPSESFTALLTLLYSFIDMCSRRHSLP